MPSQIANRACVTIDGAQYYLRVEIELLVFEINPKGCIGFCPFLCLPRKESLKKNNEFAVCLLDN